MPGSQFNTLEDFLTSTPTHVDGVLDDGFGLGFPVKGREIDATILFADISGFSSRTASLSPTETLIYVQNYFAFMTAEALYGRPGIIDKYIGDEMMVIFSREFGSADPIEDAVRAAAAMSRRDVHAYSPHMGIASGPVVVGYVGTSRRFGVSVFGAPVAMAARCAGVKPLESDRVISSTIVMPSQDWDGHEIEDVLPGEKRILKDDTEQTLPSQFELQASRTVAMKGLGEVEVIEIQNTGLWIPSPGGSAEERAAQGLEHLRRARRYWPPSEGSE